MALEIEIEGKRYIFDSDDCPGSPPGKRATVGDAEGLIGEIHSIHGTDGAISTSVLPHREPRDHSRALLERIADRWRATRLRRGKDIDGNEFFERSCMACGAVARALRMPPRTREMERCSCGLPVEFDVTHHGD